MFIIKNSFRAIMRSKGRNILMIVLITVVASATCISLAINNAANVAKESGLSNVSITGTISADREKLIANAQKADPSTTGVKITRPDSPSFETMQSYANLSSVNSYYYTQSVSVAKNSIEPYSDSSTDTSSSESTSKEPGGNKGFMMGSQGDFQITGYSDDTALSNAQGGKFTMSSGKAFTYDKADNTCIINKTLADADGLKVGNKLTFENPNKSSETYVLKVVGVYENASEEESDIPNASGSMDPANGIYVNYKTLASIVAKSKKSPATVENSRSGTSAYSDDANWVYKFSDKDKYNEFVNQVSALGLDENFKVSSADIDNYESSIAPLENLSRFAIVLLLIILGIGAIVLIVLNMFNIRERKYEIGVYTAIGIKKRNIAFQFMSELLIITVFGLALGSFAGAVSSVPISNAMLSQQISSEQSQQQNQTQMFGRDMQGGPRGGMTTTRSNLFGAASNSTVSADPISQINAAVNPTVLLELLGIGLGLVAISSLGAILFISRYEPLQILQER